MGEGRQDKPRPCSSKSCSLGLQHLMWQTPGWWHAHSHMQADQAMLHFVCWYLVQHAYLVPGELEARCNKCLLQLLTAQVPLA